MVEVQIVPDDSIPCPGCSAYWGHPDPKLNFPNRFKVDTFCRCYNPDCKIAYYDPFSGAVEEERNA